MLRAHKPEILELLQAERRAVVRHIANHFQSSPPGRCALCGGGSRADDPFVRDLRRRGPCGPSRLMPSGMGRRARSQGSRRARD